MNLPTHLVKHILHFVSLETCIFFFPLEKIPDIQKIDFKWYHRLQDPFRKPVVRWFIRNKILLRDTLHDIGSLDEDNGIYFLDLLAHNLELCKEFKQLSIMFLESNSQKFYSHNLVDWCCSVGNIDVLHWWFNFCKNHKLPFLYSKYAMDSASIQGHITILDWWTTQNLEIKYSKRAIDKCYHITILDWWLSIRKPLIYSAEHIDYCSDKKILDWWLIAHLEYGLELRYKNWCIINASANGRIDILDWWYKNSKIHSISMKYNELAIDNASANGKISVLDWWLEKWENDKLHLKYTNKAIDYVSANGYINILEWWFQKYKQGKVSFKRSELAIHLASKNGEIGVLNWWLNLSKKYKITMLYNDDTIETSFDDQDVIEWWCLKFNKMKKFLRK